MKSNPKHDLANAKGHKQQATKPTKVVDRRSTTINNLVRFQFWVLRIVWYDFFDYELNESELANQNGRQSDRQSLLRVIEIWFIRKNKKQVGASSIPRAIWHPWDWPGIGFDHSFDCDLSQPCLLSRLVVRIFFSANLNSSLRHRKEAVNRRRMSFLYFQTPTIYYSY